MPPSVRQPRTLRPGESSSARYPAGNDRSEYWALADRGAALTRANRVLGISEANRRNRLRRRSVKSAPRGTRSRGLRFGIAETATQNPAKSREFPPAPSQTPGDEWKPGLGGGAASRSRTRLFAEIPDLQGKYREFTRNRLPGGARFSSPAPSRAPTRHVSLHSETGKFLPTNREARDANCEICS